MTEKPGPDQMDIPLVREVELAEGNERNDSPRISPPPVGNPSDVRVVTHDDRVRKELARTLVWLLIVVVTASFVMYVIFVLTDRDTSQFMPLVQLFFTSVLTLVSTVLGFYFGSEQRRARGGPAESPPGAG